MPSWYASSMDWLPSRCILSSIIWACCLLRQSTSSLCCAARSSLRHSNSTSNPTSQSPLKSIDLGYCHLANTTEIQLARCLLAWILHHSEYTEASRSPPKRNHFLAYFSGHAMQPSKNHQIIRPWLFELPWMWKDRPKNNLLDGGRPTLWQ